jgi:hypothetical protein
MWAINKKECFLGRYKGKNQIDIEHTKGKINHKNNILIFKNKFILLIFSLYILNLLREYLSSKTI